MNQIYLNIRQIRIEKRLSQQFLARRLNIVVSAYSKIERGLTQLTIERLESIAEILNVTIDYIRNYHLDKKVNEKGMQQMTTQKMIEVQMDTLCLLKCQVESLITTRYDSIMATFPGVKEPYNEIKDNPILLSWYEENGFHIRSKADYENAPALVTHNSEDEFYQGFIQLMKDYEIYYFFKFGLFPESLSSYWEKYRMEYDPSSIYPLEVKFDVKLISTYFNSISVNHEKYFGSKAELFVPF